MKKLPPLVKLALDAAEELKATDIKLIPVAQLTPVTDYMLICTGTSTRHVKSIAENVALRAKQSGHPPRAVEGGAQSDWVLVDLGDVIVHAMQVQARAFYQLEKLWDMQTGPASKTAASPKSAAPAKTKTKPKSKPAAGRKAVTRKAPRRAPATAKKKAPKRR